MVGTSTNKLPFLRKARLSNQCYLCLFIFHAAIPDRPFFKDRTTSTITVGWTLFFLQTIIYKLEVNLHQMAEWRDAVCVDSISPGRCNVEKSYATVTGLNASAIYHFRVYAILNVAESHPSMPSVGLSPRGAQGIFFI